MIARAACIALIVAASRADGLAASGVDEDVSVVARCAPVASPGRVRCDVELRTAAPRELRWADVQVLATPAFVTPLKGRVGPADAAVREPTLVRFALGLVAKERGQGDATLRVRAVVCHARACAPFAREATASVSVGAPNLPAPPPPRYF